MTKTLQIIGIVLLSAAFLIGALSLVTSDVEDSDSSIPQTLQTNPF